MCAKVDLTMGESKSKVSLTLKEKASSMTWDEATMPWEEADSPWEAPKVSLTRESKTKVDLTKESK